MTVGTNESATGECSLLDSIFKQGTENRTHLTTLLHQWDSIDLHGKIIKFGIDNRGIEKIRHDGRRITLEFQNEDHIPKFLSDFRASLKPEEIQKFSAASKSVEAEEATFRKLVEVRSAAKAGDVPAR